MGYTPLRISTLKHDKHLTFDVYLFFKRRYLCYIKTGSGIERTRLGKLKKQRIAKFFILDTDEAKYQKFLDEILADVVKSTDTTVDEKASVVSGAAQTAIERMKKDPGSQAAYNMTQNAAKSLRQVITGNTTALKSIFGKKASENDTLVKHSLNVSALATKLGQKCKLSEKELDDLVTAALLHDLGVTLLSATQQALFYKKKKDLTLDELKLYNEHPKKAVAILQDKPYVNREIIDLIINHTENLQGGGINKKLMLSPQEEIISLCNVYDKKVTCLKMNQREAFKDLQINELGNYSLPMINKLKEVIQEEGLADVVANEEEN